MIIDLRNKYISNQLETNMYLFCDDNYCLIQFFYNGIKFNISSYNEEEDGIYIQYFNDIIILPPSLTVYKI